MTTEPLELFYSYAPEDEALRAQLETHLTLLKRQNLIRGWHHRAILAGQDWQQEIDSHLRSAHIILLLVSPAFIASDYCYGTEMIQAMERHASGSAHVIPLLLRPCDWEATPFGKLQALPKSAKPVTLWSNRDAAFTDIVKGLRAVIAEINSSSSDGATSDIQKADTQKKRLRKGNGMENIPPATPTAPTTTATIGTSALKTAINTYYKELKEFEGINVDYELAVRSAFQNLLAYTARNVNWTLIPEQTIEGNIRPDGVLRDHFNLKRGFWEAKGPKSDLEKEIKKKKADGYPLTNTIFENTRQAILYQNKQPVFECELKNSHEVSDLLKQFFTYTEPDIANFEVAVQEFKERIPELAGALLETIEKEYKLNKRFVAAFDTFAALCRTSLNPQISTAAINEMLVQHLLTKRLFRTIFDNSDFTNRNVIAAEIERVITALTSREFNPNDFLKRLDRFYVAIEGAAKDIGSWSERQKFLNTVYERFFQGFSIKQADTHGIVYTPQEIVDFMCASVEEVLKTEFNTSLSEPGIQILDPATGTGNFIVNLIKRIPRSKLKHKYMHDLFCNEITLLPYYIASLNIEHEYYDRMKEYEPFEGVCFADTLELAEGQQLPLFVEQNTERVQHEKDAQIMVVIGNPPYNVGQVNENDNNKNRKYPVIDQRIRETYAKSSKATLNTKLYDAYVKFFRWATDRLQNRDGIICLVSNNSFVDQIAFDGMRKHLLQDFTQIYHLDLHGNVRKNPKISGTTHNVFGIQVGIGITIAIRNSQNAKRGLYYYRVPEKWTKVDKASFLVEKGSIQKIEWQELQPDTKFHWLTADLQSEFSTFLPLGTREVRNTKLLESKTLFKTYSLGVNTSRDTVVYDFDNKVLEDRVKQFIDDYDSEVARWSRAGHPSDIDNFVRYERIKWSRNLKRDLKNERYTQFDVKNMRRVVYRPFTTEWLYLADVLVDELGKSRTFFPNQDSEEENVVIAISDHGFRSLFSAMATAHIPDLHLLASADGFQCFPYYTYAEDGSNRRENITDWALEQFQSKYGRQVIKFDIFYYIYAILHHTQYRFRYIENLRHDLPHIPLLRTRSQFEVCVHIGKDLMDLHLNYEQAKEYDLEWQENEDVPFDWRVEKMRLTADKTALIVNESLTLAGIPPECFEYRLGNRSALEWIIDQYQVSEDKRSGIKSDPNNLDDEEYIIRLVGRVITVSMETVRLVNELAALVKAEDWLNEEVNLEGSL
ncbi:MAG: N-6 DNA methylase [Ktedonobacteraceae bacterium]|nr:N-6 DNA methylase [Ktedonobacteraceae bacterium]